MVPGTVSGTAFTLSAPEGDIDYGISLNTTRVLATNGSSTVANTFTRTWDDGTGGTQANSVSLTGVSVSDIFYITSGGTAGGAVQAQNDVAFSGAQITGIQFRLSGDFDCASRDSF